VSGIEAGGSHYRQLFMPILRNIFVASQLETSDELVQEQIKWTLNCLEGLISGTTNGVYLTSLFEVLESEQLYSSMTGLVYKIDDLRVVIRVLKVSAAHQVLFTLCYCAQELLIDQQSTKALVSSVVSILKPVLEILKQRYAISLGLGKNEFFDCFVRPLNVSCEICASLLGNSHIGKLKDLEQVIQLLLQVLAEVDLRKISYCLENLGPLYQFLSKFISILPGSLQKLSPGLLTHLLLILALGFDISDIFIKQYVIEALMSLTMKTKLLSDTEDDEMNKKGQKPLSESDIKKTVKILKEKILCEVFDPNNMMSGYSIRLVFQMLQKGYLSGFEQHVAPEVLSFDPMMKLLKDTQKNPRSSVGVFVEEFEKIKDPQQSFYK